MKKIFFVFTIITSFIVLCACSAKNMADMTTELGDGYSAVVWDNQTYIPYGALASYGKRGKQIGIVDGNKDHKVYECKGYSADEWIVTALPYDAPMLYREKDTTDIPNGWQSEYKWNK